MVTKRRGRPPKVRRTVTTVEEDQDLSQAGHGAQRDDTQEMPDDVIAVLEELGDQVGSIVLMRYTAAGALEYIATIAVESFSLQFVQEWFGGGRYLARLKAPHGSYVRAKTFHVAGRSKDPDHYRATVESTISTDGESTDRIGRLEALVEQLVSGRAANGGNPLELATGMAQAMMGAATQMAKLMQSPTATNPTEHIGMVRELMGLAREMASDSGPDEGYSGVIKEVGIPLLRQIQQMGAQERIQSGQSGQQPAALPETSLVPEDRWPTWVRRVSEWVPQLAWMAERNKRPDMYAEMLLDNIDHDTTELLVGQLARGSGLLEDLMRYFPSLRPHSDYLTKFFGEVGLLLAQTDDDDEMAGPVPDPKGDG